MTNLLTVFVLGDVSQERDRQDELLRAGKIPWNCADSEVSPADKYLVLAEEVGEVSRAIMEGGDVYGELVQVAAVATAFAESVRP